MCVFLLDVFQLVQNGCLNGILLHQVIKILCDHIKKTQMAKVRLKIFTKTNLQDERSD